MLLYETAQDLKAEAELRTTIEQRLKCRCVKIPIAGRLDYMAIRQYPGDRCFYVAAWLELKVRSGAILDYDSVILSKAKITEGLKLRTHFGNYKTNETIPFFFFVRFEDGDFYAKIEGVKEEWNAKVISAKDTEGVTRERDEVVFIPLSEFKQL